MTVQNPGVISFTIRKISKQPRPFVPRDPPRAVDAKKTGFNRSIIATSGCAGGEPTLQRRAPSRGDPYIKTSTFAGYHDNAQSRRSFIPPSAKIFLRLGFPGVGSAFLPMSVDSKVRAGFSRSRFAPITRCAPFLGYFVTDAPIQNSSRRSALGGV
jgi:hypothetical protein